MQQQPDPLRSVSELQNPDAFAILDNLRTLLRHAVEDRNYTRVQELVSQQRAVFEQVGAQHPDARQHALVDRDLAAWALTMVRLQRAHDQHALLELVAFKKMAESYAPPPARSVTCLAG